MSKYTNVDEAREALRADFCENFLYDIDEYETVLGFLDSLPSADVVEVVRCKDCIYHGKRNDKECCTRLEVAFPIMYGDDFCSYGEREEIE